MCSAVSRTSRLDGLSAVKQEAIAKPTSTASQFAQANGTVSHSLLLTIPHSLLCHLLQSGTPKGKAVVISSASSAPPPPINTAAARKAKREKDRKEAAKMAKIPKKQPVASSPS